MTDAKSVWISPKRSKRLTHQSAVLRQLICLPDEHLRCCSWQGFTSHSSVTEVSLGSPPWGGDLHSSAIGLLVLRENSTPLPWDRGMGRWMMQVVLLILTSQWGHALQRLNGEGHIMDQWQQFSGSQPVFSPFNNIAPKHWAIKFNLEPFY